MAYLLSFLEGIITFISPCLLPMLPIYVSYFAGGSSERHPQRTLLNALGFILGFTIVFLALGALAGTLGALLTRYHVLVDLVTGAIVIFFGLSYMGVFRLTIFKGLRNPVHTQNMGFFSAILFGLVFSIGWTPCVGTFLGSALMMASQQGQVLAGVLMLLVYSLGLGIPFLLSALLIDSLKSTFTLIKQHYDLINRICGLFLILVGILMMTGLLGRFLTLLS